MEPCSGFTTKLFWWQLLISVELLQVNLFQKPSFLHQLTHNMTRDCSLNSPKNTSSEHVVYKYCFECQNKNKKQFLYTTCCELVFFREFNEQSLVILRVNRCKNESFWKRFTCKMKVFYSDDLHFPVKSTLRLLVKSKKVWLYMNLFPYSILILPNVKSVLN